MTAAVLVERRGEYRAVIKVERQPLVALCVDRGGRGVTGDELVKLKAMAHMLGGLRRRPVAVSAKRLSVYIHRLLHELRRVVVDFRIQVVADGKHRQKGDAEPALAA